MKNISLLAGTRLERGRTVAAPGGLACLLLSALLLTACVGVTRAPSRASIPEPAAGALDVYVAGDIAYCGGRDPADSMAARTARLLPAGALVLGLGDMAYPLADAAMLASCYEPTWGSHRATTLAVPGNHDYVGGKAIAYLDYFGGPATSQNGNFIAYTRRLNDRWLLIGLDSNAAGTALDAQYRWLQQALAQEAERGAMPRCTAVMWHAPLFSSGLHRGAGDHMRPFWKLLDEHGADVVLSGHEHMYERFGPLDAGGQAPASGGLAPRQFVVGTGGAPLYGFWRPPYRSEARVLRHGVLRLSLEQDSYTWRFIDVDGTVRDAGTARCRAAAN